ncbi:MAG: hypothetical protein AAGC63_05530 [Propionicimonas sp.]|nr:hypothetical protein [Propionicimonas sp.]
MDLADFYSLMAITCFTLVGLWWTVIERHQDWKTDLRRRRLAGGVYLSFLLPGLMSTFAQVDTGSPLVWRASFAVAALVGLVSTARMVALDHDGPRGPFRRHRWLAGVFYLLVAVLGAFPELAGLAGLTGLQAASLALIGLIVLGHGMAWEFMMEPEAEAGDPAETGD